MPDVSPEDQAPVPRGPVERPTFGGRLTYLVGSPLPPRHREWVRKDLMTSGWRNRQARRPMLLMLPFVIAFAILPGTASLRLSLIAFLAIGAVVMGYSTSGYFRSRRLEQHGLPPIVRREEDEDL